MTRSAGATSQSISMKATPTAASVGLSTMFCFFLSLTLSLICSQCTQGECFNRERQLGTTMELLWLAARYCPMDGSVSHMLLFAFFFSLYASCSFI